jgi:tetratricopeptide (TPR) repeat protein
MIHSKKLLLLAAVLCQIATFGQTPEKIYSIAVIQESNDYYQEQIRLWGEVLRNDSTNGEAWVNYYKANRFCKMIDESDDNGQKRMKRLNAIVEKLGVHLPDSYEFNYLMYYNSGNSREKASYLLRAHELQPKNLEHYPDIVFYYDFNRKMKERDELLRFWYESGTMSPGMLQYNYNVLAGLEKNAILLTAGDNDTYPAWLVQAGKNFRPDVTVVNVNFLYFNEQRNLLFQELGVPELDVDPETNYEDFKIMRDSLVRHLAKNAGKRPVYVAVTAMSTQYVEQVKDDLYLTGLAYLYSDSHLDNIAFIKRNFDRVYLLDYLNETFYQDVSEDLVKLINTNYIIALVNLIEHYKRSGDEAKSSLYMALARKLAKGSERHEKYWNKYLDEL